MQPLDRLIAGIILGALAFVATDHFNLSDSPSAPPIAGKGFHVLFIQETHDLTKIPSNQRYIATSEKVAKYCNAKCPKDSVGQPGWRIFDPQQPTEHESSIWQNAMKQPHEPTPWLMVSDGKKGSSRPLPKSLDETMTVLQKYGGR
jgi:hypothetical protein